MNNGIEYYQMFKTNMGKQTTAIISVKYFYFPHMNHLTNIEFLIILKYSRLLLQLTFYISLF